MARRRPIRREQTRVLIACVALLIIGTLAFSAFGVMSAPEQQMRYSAKRTLDDATWLSQAIGARLDTTVRFTQMAEGAAGLRIEQLRGRREFLVLFDAEATRIDVCWVRTAPGILAVVPDSLREQFADAPATGGGDHDNELHLSLERAERQVQLGDSRPRAALTVLAYALTDRTAALDEYGFALRRYAGLLGSVIHTLDTTAATAQAPLPAELAALHRQATRLRDNMTAQADLMTRLMGTILDADQSDETRRAAEQRYNGQIEDVNTWLDETVQLVFRFLAVGPRYQVEADQVLQANRDILDTLFQVTIAHDTGVQRQALALLMITMIAVAGSLATLVAAHRLRFPATVRRELRGFGIRDATLQATLMQRYREAWLDSRDARDVLVPLRHDCREWLKQHREQAVFGFEARPQVLSAPAGEEPAPAAQSDDATALPLDKRQQRARKRRERDEQQQREAAATRAATIETWFDLVGRVLRAADFDLYDVENVPSVRLEELARYLPEARRQLPRRLWRRWCRAFVGSDDATWMPLLLHARKNEWPALRDAIERDDEAATASASPSARPAAQALPAGAQPFAGQSVVVIGGNPWMRGFYTSAVQQLGAARARWFDGTHDVSRLDRLGADVVILLYKGLSHGTSRRVTARQVPGRQARLIFSDHPGRSRFVSSIVDALETGA
ncbi:MAG: hypothetical protein AB7K09_12400 [Planctomycetota bacterium]